MSSEGSLYLNFKGTNEINFSISTCCTLDKNQKMTIMRRNLLAIVTLFAAFIFVACGNQDNQANQIEENAKQAFGNVEENLQAGKEQLLTKVEEGLASVDAEMEEIEQKIQEAPEQTQSTLQEQWDKLKEQKQSLEDKISEAKNSENVNWQEMQKTLSEEWNTFQENFNQFKSELGMNGSGQ
jgi:hypothetical protein